MIDIFNKKYCPCCNVQTENNIFYKAFGIPILNNVVYHTHQEGKDAQTGDVQLQACSNCGFFYNSSFNPKFIQYDSRYNSSRVYSSIFNQYLDQIVEHISTFTSKNENILELGCGDGEFLKKLCQKCSVQGFGYDIFVDDAEKDSCNLIHFKKAPYPELGEHFDLIILRHILENIEFADQYIKDVVLPRQKKSGRLIIEVPDFNDSLKNGNYFDITYEHCNYFTKNSLCSLLERNQYTIEKCVNVFDGQYILCIAIYQGTITINESNIHHQVIDKTALLAKRNKVETLIAEKKNIVIWGASGKGVIFLSSLSQRLQAKIAYVVDINQQKQNKYIAGTGFQIHPPSVLNKGKDRPFLIIIMNSIYYDEISTYININNIEAELYCI